MLKQLNAPLKEVLKVIQYRLSKSTYLGVPIAKNPLDFWVYQEIIYKTRPQVIIEIGNGYGGMLLAAANLCDILGSGTVIGVDINNERIYPQVCNHKRIITIKGDACAVFAEVEKLIQRNSKVFIIEDSSHSYNNTLNVLRTYSVLNRIGDYFVVEDGICGHGLDIGPSPGPYEAVKEFLKENKNFIVDETKESFMITWNPGGYLKRV